MISTDSFKIDWIKSNKKSKGSDPSILEKMIWAYYLVENLTLSSLKFTFKGGTSLSLVFNKLQRFSVDIDIVTIVKKEELEDALDNVINNSLFKRWGLDDKRSYKKGIPKAHYYFIYDSEIVGKENTVLLDVLFDDYEDSDTINCEIKSDIIITTEPMTLVVTPSINFFMADKLTAFAPNTIGIPYNKLKEREIIKQIFDLNFLFEEMNDLNSVLEGYKVISSKQISYRNLEIDFSDTLKDTIETSILIALGRNKIFRTNEDEGHYKEIQRGINQFKSFISGVSFNIDEVVIASSKIAYLASVLLSNLKKEFKRFDINDDINNYLILNPIYNKLNKLKNFPKGPLYYLYHTLEEKAL